VLCRYVSLFTGCPFDFDAYPMLIDANDDDNECFDTNAGASRVGPEFVNGSQTFFVVVERSIDAMGFSEWDPNAVYQFELQISCQVMCGGRARDCVSP
jgi:hypothetical protein